MAADGDVEELRKSMIGAYAGLGWTWNVKGGGGGSRGPLIQPSGMMPVGWRANSGGSFPERLPSSLPSNQLKTVPCPQWL